MSIHTALTDLSLAVEMKMERDRSIMCGECSTVNYWTDEEMVNHRPRVAAIRIEVALENREALPDFL